MLNKLSLIFACCAILFLSCSKPDSGLNFYGQLAKDDATIDSYLTSNSIDAYHNVNGMRFSIISLGTGGFPAKLENTVKVILEGRYLSNNQIFLSETTVEKKLSFFDIAGLQYGISYLPKGTKAKVYIPSGLGYGNEVYNAIPANTNLIYYVEVLDVKRTSTEIQQLATDVSAIDSYLTNHTIEHTADTTGIRYVIQNAGSGTLPSWYDKIKFTYILKRMDTGTTILTGTNEPGTSFDSRVVDYIQGLMVGMQKISKGGKATFYIPSVLAFGATGVNSGGIISPANVNLIYEVELTDITFN